MNEYVNLYSAQLEKISRAQKAYVSHSQTQVALKTTA